MEPTPATPNLPTPEARLLALDLLRGLDMLLLTVVGPVLWAVHRVWALPPWVCKQLTHARWEGLTTWDLIMPLFIFMCGAAVPFALGKRLRGKWPGRAYLRHVLGRVVLLWILGMMVQGELLTLDPAHIILYNNTLQAIAVGYLIAACAFPLPWRALRAALPLVLAALYGLLLACLGDYTPDGNFAVRLERTLFPGNTDGYGWTLTSLMFGAMTLWGMNCAELLRGGLSPRRKVVLLAALGLAALLGGLALGNWEPAIKRIYTVSFTAQAMGWCTLLLAVLYLWADVLRLARGPGLVVLFGRHALAAYLLGTFFAPVIQTAAALLTQGIPHWLGPAPQPFVQALAAALLLAVALRLLAASRANVRMGS